MSIGALAGIATKTAAKGAATKGGKSGATPGASARANAEAAGNKAQSDIEGQFSSRGYGSKTFGSMPYDGSEK